MSLPVVESNSTLASKPKTFLIIPVHNRREITLGCLAHLQKIGVLDWATPIVVDDGSTDGTSEAIAREFPQTILLHGDGNLWWTGAMVKGMKAAIEQGAEMIVWLNDDCYPRHGTIEMIVDYSQKHQCITTAQTKTLIGYYGGQKKKAFGVTMIFCPEGEILECDTVGGNCVSIPYKVVKTIGMPDAEHMPHGGGDHDFGLRASKAGFRVVAMGSAICDNRESLNPFAQSWLLDDQSFSEHWRKLRGIKSPFYPYTRWNLLVRHWGLWGIAIFPLPYLKFFVYQAVKAIIPRGILRKVFGHHSKEWQNTKRQKRMLGDGG